MAQLIKDIITTSGVDTYTGNLKTKYAEYQYGLYMIKIGSTNTGASTLNLDGLGAVAMVDIAGNPLAAGSLPAGRSFIGMYDGTNFIMYGIVTTADTNFAVADLDFTANRTHDFAGHTLSFIDSTMAGSNYFNLDLTNSGTGLDFELTDNSGAFLSMLVNTGQFMYTVDDGTSRTGLIEVNNGYSSIQVSDYLGSYPGTGGFIAHGRQFQILGEAVFKSIEATDDTILSSDLSWYPYVVSGILKGRYRATGGGLSDIKWDYTKIQPGTNGQFLKTASGASTWANIQYSDITGAPTVSGTTNRMAKFNGSSTVGNSQIIDDGTQISINGGSTFSNVLFNIQKASGYDAMGGFLNSNGTPVGAAAYGVISGAIGTGSVNVGGWFYAAKGTNYSVQLQDGTQGAGKFLKSITSDGKANWATLAYSDIASMTSAQFATLISDETGTGNVVFSNSPTLVTPVLGTATATQITVAADPTLALQVATKQYVDNLIAGLKFKQDVVAASTANVNVSSAPSTLDGVTLVSGDRVLLKNQTTASENGPYQFNGAGSALTRTTDGDTGAELVSATFPVRGGTVNQDTWYTVTNDSITIGVTSIVFTQTGGAGTYAAGTGLSLTGNIFSIDSSVVTLTGSQTLTNKTLTSPIINRGQANSLTQLSTRNTGSGAYDLAIVANETMTSNKNLTIKLNDVSRTVIFGGNIQFDGAFTMNGAYSFTGTLTATTSITYPTSGTLYGTASGSITSAQLATSMTDETGSGALVFGTSPTLATPVINGLPTGTGVASAPTASTLMTRDSNGNAFVNNIGWAYTTTATAAGTTTLTVASARIQYFTGTTTQTVVLPVVSTLTTGFCYLIHNEGTAAVTVQSSGNNNILVLAAGTSAWFICILTTGTSAASWDYDYNGVITASGKSLTVNNTITFSGTDATTITFQGTDTYVGRTTTDTLTNKTLTTPSIASIKGTLTTDTDGATITFDKNVSDFHTVTLAGNRTLAVSNMAAGDRITLVLVQDATGSRTISSWFTTIKWAGGSAPTLTATANKADIVSFLCTSAGNYYGVVIAQNL